MAVLGLSAMVATGLLTDVDAGTGAAVSSIASFLGLWILGWDGLSPRVHLATVWLFALRSAASLTSGRQRPRSAAPARRRG